MPADPIDPKQQLPDHLVLIIFALGLIGRIDIRAGYDLEGSNERKDGLE
jgi:hypothetical protein